MCSPHNMAKECHLCTTSLQALVDTAEQAIGRFDQALAAAQQPDPELDQLRSTAHSMFHNFELQSGVHLKAQHAAAATIQANWKGYRQRVTFRNRRKAAITLQAYVRGHQVRGQIAGSDCQEECSPPCHSKQMESSPRTLGFQAVHAAAACSSPAHSGLLDRLQCQEVPLKACCDCRSELEI